MSFVVGTRPYPWPFDGDLDPAGLALLVVGAQRWWQDRTHGSDLVMDRLARVADTIRSVGGVVVVRHGAVRGLDAGAGPARLPARVGPGWNLARAPGPNDHVIDAGGVDGFFASSLGAELRGFGRTRLVVGGLGLESTSTRARPPPTIGATSAWCCQMLRPPTSRRSGHGPCPASPCRAASSPLSERAAPCATASPGWRRSAHEL